MSVKSVWFQEFLAGEPSFEHLFLTESPDMDPRSVTRPRTTPLLTPFQRPDGSTVYVWTTFSADQADFDYRDPETLLRILQVLLFYVEQGAQALRLDAIAYLWKQVGTSCIHLPQTHAVIQLMRAVFDLVAPQVVLITETNVPHAENIAYFGSPDFPEAQLIYNFTLPPLLLHTLLSGNAHLLCDWVNTLDAPAEQTTFFNFTASHDGIGVRPVEGILSAEQLTRLIAHVERCGGRVSYKANPDGSRSPYELNITYVDATAGQDAPPDVQVRRFLVSQAVMLALAGVPAIYIHSLLGSRNDVVGMQQAGYPRAINRQKLPIDDVLAELADPSSFRAQVFQGYLNLIRARRQTPAFHPRAGQSAFDLSDGGVFALERIARAGTERVLCLFNITDKTQAVETGGAASVDLLSGEVCGNRVTLEPYQVRWLRYHR
jgi:sucrose phosphorylase